MGLGNCFKGRQFTAEAILWAVRWYLMFPVSYRDLELMLLDRGGTLDLSLSGGGQPTADNRFPSVCTARYGRGQTVLSQGHGATACRQSANPHRRQESCLSQSGRRYERRRSAIAPHLSAAMQIPQQHRRARPPAYQAPCAARARLRQFPYRAANFGGFRNDGDDEEGTASTD